ncbi:MAG: hypothetical protein U0903_12995 [Planctomycetales bacterium]
MLEIVRGMVESGRGLSVMGNHELNALAYHTPHPGKPGEYLRPHIHKNNHQHRRRWSSCRRPRWRVRRWFRTLPLWLDLEGLRVVHACWDGEYLKQIKAGLERCGG